MYVIKDSGHLAQTDLPLLLSLEMALCYMIPTFKQMLRGRRYIRITSDLVSAFFRLNRVEEGKFTEIVEKIKKKKAVIDDLKYLK